MSIPASELVDIQPRTIGGGLNGIELNGMLLTTSTLVPTKYVYPFGSPETVGQYFGYDSEEYSLALIYFNADDNKQKVPSALYFYHYTGGAVAAWIRGAGISIPLTTFQAVTDGALNININGTVIALTNIDLSSASSFSAVAQTLQTALAATVEGTTVAYNSNFSAFIITSGTSGNESTIAYPSHPEEGTDLAALMNLYETDGSLLSQGSDALTVAETMQNVLDSFRNWFSFMPVFQETDEQKMQFANWCNSQGTRFLYAANEINENSKVPNNSSCFAKQVSDYKGIMNSYNTKEICSFVMGVIAATDYERLRGRKTLAYRTQSGLTPTVDNLADSQALLGNGYNYYGSYATASEEFNSFQNGQISGAASWIDTYAGQVWLAASLQADWITLMMNSNTLPFNELGYTTVRTAALDTINAGINNGLIVPGVTLSNAQKDQLYREAGIDISEALYNQGWYLQIPDASTSTRVARGPLLPNFWYCDGGSIQKIDGTSTTIL